MDRSIVWQVEALAIAILRTAGRHGAECTKLHDIDSSFLESQVAKSWSYMLPVRPDNFYSRKVNMKTILGKRIWTAVACFSLWPMITFAQSSDRAQNLADCKNGPEGCHFSKLSQAQSAEVARASQQHNLSDCRSGFQSCDRSKLGLQTHPNGSCGIGCGRVPAQTFQIARADLTPAIIHD